MLLLGKRGPDLDGLGRDFLLGAGRELESESEDLVVVEAHVVVKLLAQIHKYLHHDLLHLIIMTFRYLEQLLHNEVPFRLDFEVHLCQVQC